MESDAALVPESSTYVSSVLQNQRNIQKIELDDLIDLEKDLSIGEKIGTIFLLYGSDKELVNAAIQHILHILRNPLSDSTFIYQWAKGTDNWQEPLVESLCITQSYHITEKLNLDMKRLEEVYMPYRYGVALSINPVVKSLFLMAECLVIKETEMLIQYMADKGTTNFSDHNYIELHLLDWIRKNLIEVYGLAKIDVLYEFLKQCEIHEALEPLESFKTKIIEKKTPSSTINSTDCYKIRRELCGYVLIINQRTFTRPNPAQIPPGVEIEEKELRERTGTDADCIALKRAFSARGYKIDVRKDLTHIKLRKALHDIVQASIVYDSLIVCILSHGNKGVVFGSDYIPVNITTIQEILSSELLLNKPKVLIIQACQGQKKNVSITASQRTRSRLETDDASHQAPVSAPKYADLLTAMSTIEGFVSVRDKEKGTWYIQEVCKSIEERGDEEHILDLLTDVNNKVAQKRHLTDEEELCMLPEFSVRLLKKMYLPKKICEGAQQ